MKKSLKVIIGVVVTIALLWGVIFIIDYNRCSNLKKPIFVIEKNGQYIGFGYKVIYEQNKVEMYMFNKCIAGSIADIAMAQNDIVIIENGQIQNENLIDEFIEKVADREEAELIIKQDNDNIKLEYIPGETKINEEGIKQFVNIPQDDTPEEYRRVYGYYTLNVNNVEVKKVEAMRYFVARRCEGDNVYLTFSAIGTICFSEPNDICKYNLNSSNYKRNFEITYNQRKDLGIKKIAEFSDYDIYTYGGDVTITIDGDMVYNLEDAISKKIISADDIVEQAKMDEKYGVCEEGYYADGGSTEYYYLGCTILKYNTLNNNKDLVIGMCGQIINNVNKILFK